MLRRVGVGLMESRQWKAKPLRRPADLVEGDESVIAIECRVLDALGHHGTGILLNLHCESEARGAAQVVAPGFRLDREKQITKKVEGRGVNVGVGAPRAD